MSLVNQLLTGERGGLSQPLAKIQSIQFGDGTTAVIINQYSVRFEIKGTIKAGSDMKKNIRSIFTYLLMFTVSAMPFHSLADPATTGREGQQFAQGLINTMQTAPGTVEDGKLTLPSMSDGEFDPDGEEISLSELFPGSEDASGDYYADGTLNSTDDLGGIYNSSADMNSMGNDAEVSLYNDAMSGDPTLSGAAYKVLLDAANRTKPDFANDPAFNPSRDQLSDLVTSDFGDCSVETSISKESRDAHIPDIQTCDRAVDRSAQCEITHEYDAHLLEHYSGPYNIEECGTGCLDLYIGEVGDDYWQGDCSVYERSTSIKITNPGAITSATLEYAKYDDYMQILVGPIGSESKVWQGPNGNFPPETAGACELDTSWEQNLGVNLTSKFNSVAPGTVVNFKIRVSVTGHGEGYGRIKLRYDPNKVVTKDEWYPEDCIEAGMGIEDGFASGDLICTDKPSVTDGCTVINGLKVCENHMKPSPFPSKTPFCRAYTVDAEFDFYKGQMDCWTDPDGEEHCPVNDGSNFSQGDGERSSCQALEENPQCGFISTECVEGSNGAASSMCYLYEDRYDCGGALSIDTLEKETAYSCGGPIKCMGDECLDIHHEESSDFARASALLNAAQFMGNDMSCDLASSGNTAQECRVFPGEAGECKKAVGGTVNCCEKPSNVGMGDYLQLIMQVPKLDSAIMTLDSSSSVRSAYNVLREPMANTWSNVTKPFTNYADGIASNVVESSEPIAKMTEVMKDIISDIYTSATGQAAEGAAVENTVSTLIPEGASTLLNSIMTAYSYYVVAMLVIQIIWECEEEEFQLNANRAMNLCSYVGSYCETKVLGVCIEKRQSYCCYSSPLSRIIQEQVMPQLGMDYGSAKNPQCGGIPLSQLEQINWDEVDLDEWTAILQQHGRLGDMSGLSLDQLTGSGSTFAGDQGRLSADDRTIQRFEGIDGDQARKDSRETILINPGQ